MSRAVMQQALDAFKAIEEENRCVIPSHIAVNILVAMAALSTELAKPEAVAVPVVDDEETFDRVADSDARDAAVPQGFVDWLCREMPPHTIIGDPKWWAPRIWKAAMRGEVES